MSPRHDMFQAREVPGLLGISEAQFEYMCKKGWLKVVKRGAATLIGSKEVSEYLAKGIREGRIRIELPQTTAAA